MKRSSASGSFDVTVPSQPNRNPAGIEMIPGLLNGNHDQSWSVNSAVSEPETTGEKKTRPTHEINPP